MDKVVLLTIMKFCTRDAFLAMRLCSRRFYELAKHVNSQWFAILEDRAPRKITKNSVHNEYIRCHLRVCKKVSHYWYNSLEVKLLKTVPLCEQVMRMYAKERLALARSRHEHFKQRFEYHNDYAAMFERKVKETCGQVKFYEQLYEKYNGGKRKKVKLNHNNLF